MSKIIREWDAKAYGKGSPDKKRISALDIRTMVDRGADPEDVIDYYERGFFKKKGYKTGGGTEKAIQALKSKLKKGDEGDGGDKKKKGKKDGGGDADGKTLAEIEFENQKDLLYTRADIARDIMALEGHYEREKNELATYVGLLSNL